MTIVTDSSVIAKWIVREAGHEEAVRLLDQRYRLVCPDFALAEVANVLRRKVRTSDIKQQHAMEALERLPLYFDRFFPTGDLLLQAFEFAAQLDHSVYDCLFLALAVKEKDAVLISADDVFLQKCASTGFADMTRHLLAPNPIYPSLMDDRNG